MYTVQRERMHAHTRMCIYIFTMIKHTHIECIHTFKPELRKGKYVMTLMHAFTNTQTHSRIVKMGCRRMCFCTYTHAHTYGHTHTYTRTYIYTHTPGQTEMGYR